jgi:DNA-binding transcriptional regulator WhiA
MEESLEAVARSLETRGAIGREAIEDLQRRMRQIEERGRR